MKRTVFVLLVVLGVVAAGAAYSASSPSAKLDKQDRVWGGGYVEPGCSVNDPTFCPPAGRNISVDAHAEGNGNGAAGNTAVNNQTPRTVTCLRVDGNKAAIGGIVGSTSVANPGYWYLLYVVDRGTSSPTADRDWVSANYTMPADDPNWPTGFPNQCPAADGPPEEAYPAYLQLLGGDITVQDAPSN